MKNFFRDFLDSLGFRREAPPPKKAEQPPGALPRREGAKAAKEPDKAPAGEAPKGRARTLPKRPPDVPRRFARYSEAERDTLERYLGDAFGPVTRTFYDIGGDSPRLDVAVAEPSPGRDFYTLATVGMGANAMNVPRELREHNHAFAELTVCLPPDWDLMHDTWPFYMLQETARLPFTRDDLLGVGNAYHGPMLRGSGFSALLVTPAASRPGVSTRLMLPGGKIVNFYLLLPLYEEEWREIVDNNSAFGFWERYARRGGSVVVDPERERCTADTDEEDDAE